jgi:hypothetical protein
MNLLLDLVDIFVKWYSVEWWLTKISTHLRVSRFASRDVTRQDSWGTCALTTYCMDDTIPMEYSMDVNKEYCSAARGSMLRMPCAQ